jgi:hypothetical protein
MSVDSCSSMIGIISSKNRFLVKRYIPPNADLAKQLHGEWNRDSPPINLTGDKKLDNVPSNGKAARDRGSKNGSKYASVYATLDEASKQLKVTLATATALRPRKARRRTQRRKQHGQVARSLD